jgi:hypothetical protein
MSDEPKWPAVRDRCEDGIANCRARLDKFGTSHDESTFERGRLIALREILALAAPPKAPIPGKPVKGLYD